MAEATENFELDDDADFIELDGEKFEPMFDFEHENKTYLVLTPFLEDGDLNEDDFEFVILQMVENGDDVELSTVDDDELYDKLGEIAIAEYERINESEEDGEDGE